MNTLIEKVIQWGHDKGILGKDGKGTLEGQAKKMIEEANETLLAVGQFAMYRKLLPINRGTDLPMDKTFHPYYEAQITECMDGIGDVTVTLILLADMLDMTLEDCLQYAYDEIANRQGKMVDGTFVKDK